MINAAKAEVDWLTRRLLVALERTNAEVPKSDERLLLTDTLNYLLSESIPRIGRRPLQATADETKISLLNLRTWCFARNTVESQTAMSIVEQALSLETHH